MIPHIALTQHFQGLQSVFMHLNKRPDSQKCQIDQASPALCICEYLADLVADTYDGLSRATQEAKLEAEIKSKPHVCQCADLIKSLQGSSADSREQRECSGKAQESCGVRRWHNGPTEVKASQVFTQDSSPCLSLLKMGLLLFSFSATVSWINVYSSAVTALQFMPLPPHCGISLNSFCLIFYLIIKEIKKNLMIIFLFLSQLTSGGRPHYYVSYRRSPFAQMKLPKYSLPKVGMPISAHRSFDCTEDLESNTSNCKMMCSE